MRQIIALAADESWQVALSSGLQARVESVFRRALNLSVGDQLLTLCARDGLRAPGSMLLNVDDCSKLAKVGEIVDLTAQKVCLSDSVADVNDCAWFSSQRKALNWQSSEIDCAWLVSQLKRKSPIGSFWGTPNDGFGKILATRLQKARQDFTKNPQNEDFVRQLVGLGIGLTPSGDDYLLGFLAVNRLSAHRTDDTSVLSSFIKKNLGETTDVSRHYLQAALENRLSDLVYDFLCSMERRRRDETVLDELLNYGASSGADIATGMLDAWKKLTNKENVND